MWVAGLLHRTVGPRRGRDLVGASRTRRSHRRWSRATTFAVITGWTARFDPAGRPRVWDSAGPLYDAGSYAEAADSGLELSRPTRARGTSTTTWRAARALRADRRRRRAPPAGDRSGRLSRHGEGGLRLRSDPRRARVPGADRPLTQARARESSADEFSVVSQSPRRYGRSGPLTRSDRYAMNAPAPITITPIFVADLLSRR